MLIASRVAFRFAVGTALPATRFSAPLPFRVANVALSSRQNVVLGSQRSYATPGRPKKGSIEEGSRKSRPRRTKAASSEESTEPKAVKAPKEKSTAGKPVKAPKKEESAEAKAAREAKAAAKKAKTEQKKQKVKERAAAKKQKEKERVALKKSREKAREKARKERAAAKAKPKAKAKKPLTEEQAARRKTRQDAQKVKELKASALSPPKNTKINGYAAFAQERMKQKTSNNPSNTPIVTLMTETAKEYRQLEAAQIEHYNHVANQAMETSKRQYNEWVQQHTPEQIRTANAARYKLRLLENKKPGRISKFRAIEDDRQVPLPIASPYTLYSMERYESGDYKNIAFKDVGKLIGQEWKSLGESEKQKFEDQAHRRREQYVKDYREVYGHRPTSYAPPAAETATSTA